MYLKLATEGEGAVTITLFGQPRDIDFSLFNPRALHHLQSELARYGYQENLRVLGDALAGQEHTFWQGSLYHQLLYALRTLHTETQTNSGSWPVVCRRWQRRSCGRSRSVPRRSSGSSSRQFDRLIPRTWPAG